MNMVDAETHLRGREGVVSSVEVNKTARIMSPQPVAETRPTTSRTTDQANVKYNSQALSS